MSFDELKLTVESGAVTQTVARRIAGGPRPVAYTVRGSTGFLSVPARGRRASHSVAYDDLVRRTTARLASVEDVADVLATLAVTGLYAMKRGAAFA